jgi:hypothetical protein
VALLKNYIHLKHKPLFGCMWIKKVDFSHISLQNEKKYNFLIVGLLKNISFCLMRNASFFLFFLIHWKAPMIIMITLFSPVYLPQNHTVIFVLLVTFCRRSSTLISQGFISLCFVIACNVKLFCIICVYKIWKWWMQMNRKKLMMVMNFYYSGYHCLKLYCKGRYDLVMSCC